MNSRHIYMWSNHDSLVPDDAVKRGFQVSAIGQQLKRRPDISAANTSS